MGLAKLAHVQLALEVGGYKTGQESILLAADMPSKPKALDADVKVEYDESPAVMKHWMMRESWTGFEPMAIRAMIAGEQAGRIGWVILPHLDRLGAPCMNIWALGVAEAHRRKGIAGALISRAMVRGYALGSRFGSVGTQLWNAPAHLSYAKLGYYPYAVLVGRSLKKSQEK
jgi:GNAT superfamily N-acetyltransferase